MRRSLSILGPKVGAERAQNSFNRRVVLIVAAALAALVYASTIADFLPCGRSLHLAAGWLGRAPLDTPLEPVWGWLLSLIGRSGVRTSLFGGLSAAFAVVDVLLLAYIVECVFPLAVAKARSVHIGAKKTSHFTWVTECAALLVVAAFVVTPGFWAAATRVNGLMVALVFPFEALALEAHILAGGIHRHTVKMLIASGVLTAAGCWEGPLAILFAPVAAGALWLIAKVHRRGVFQVGKYWCRGFCLGFILFPFVCIRPLDASLSVFAETFRAVPKEVLVSGVLMFAVIGIVPLMVLFRLIWTKKFLSREQCWWFVGCWSAAILAVTGYAASSGALKFGETTARFADAVVGELGGRRWLVSDGPLDDLFLMKVPEGTRLVTFARNADVKYGQELAGWVRSNLGGGEDLVFAAELGTRAFLDEWSKTDKDFKDKVLIPSEYFSTRRKWEDVWEQLKDGLGRKNEPNQRYIHRLLGSIGVGFGCGHLERGEKDEAWDVFYRVANTVDRDNMSALVNLCEMMRSGFVMSERMRENIESRLKKERERLQSAQRVKAAVAASGRVYVDENMRKKYNELMKRAEPGPQAVRLVESVKGAGKGKDSAVRARTELKKAIEDGAVKIESVSRILISLDLALNDREAAERDAFEVLRRNRHDASANALIGTFRAESKDYDAALRYLRRAVKAEPDNAHFAETLAKVEKNCHL